MRLTRAIIGVAGFWLAAGMAHASLIVFIGTDIGDNSWRTPGVAKPLDPDHDNIYGTAGYVVMGGTPAIPPAPPADVAVIQLAPLTYGGNASYQSIDNPTGPGSIQSGVWFYSGVTPGNTYNFAELDFIAEARYRVGVYTDNADFSDVPPSFLRLSGSGGDSGLIPNPGSTLGAWFFFDVYANPGDQVVISGIAAGVPHGVVGLGAVTLDAIPEPATIGPMGLAAIGLIVAGVRKRKEAARAS